MSACLYLYLLFSVSLSLSLSLSLSVSLHIYIYILHQYIYIWLRPFCFSWKLFWKKATKERFHEYILERSMLNLDRSMLNLDRTIRNQERSMHSLDRSMRSLDRSSLEGLTMSRSKESHMCRLDMYEGITCMNRGQFLCFSGKSRPCLAIWHEMSHNACLAMN
jgi:hypothetical protein